MGAYKKSLTNLHFNIDPINVKYLKNVMNFNIDPINVVGPRFSYFWINLGPIFLLAYFFIFLDIPWSLAELIVKHIIRTQNCKTHFFE